MNIRDNVKAHCKLRGITQKELAAKIGMKENTLNIILGKGNPQLSTLKQIAQGLDVSVSDLVAESPSENMPTIIEREVSYLRCPNCGRKINIWAKGEDEQQTT